MSWRGLVGNNNFLFPAAELEATEDNWQCSDSDKPKGTVLEDVLSLQDFQRARAVMASREIWVTWWKEKPRAIQIQGLHCL